MITPAWPHAPPHHVTEAGIYFVTAATYQKAHHFRGSKRLGVLHRGLLKVAADHGWSLASWAVFSNHYHFIAHFATADATNSLRAMLTELHSKTAIWINRLDGAAGRRVWHNFWETRLSFQQSYLSRLNYVHQNAVKHGWVAVANRYPWCSAGWFERTASPAQVKSIYRFKIDRIAALDEFEVAPEW